jgi:hypothetical protein
MAVLAEPDMRASADHFSTCYCTQFSAFLQEGTAYFRWFYAGNAKIYRENGLACCMVGRAE